MCYYKHLFYFFVLIYSLTGSLGHGHRRVLLSSDWTNKEGYLMPAPIYICRMPSGSKPWKRNRAGVPAAVPIQMRRATGHVPSPSGAAPT